MGDTEYLQQGCKELYRVNELEDPTELSINIKEARKMLSGRVRVSAPTILAVRSTESPCHCFNYEFR